MTDYIWYWKKGKTTFFTRRPSEAQRVMKAGHNVKSKKLKPSILRF